MMRKVSLMMLVAALCWVNPASAEHEVVVPKGSIAYPEHINEDLFAAHPECQGTWNPNCFADGKGCFEDPPCVLRFNDVEIRIKVPDTITAAEVRTVVRDYVARPSSEEKAVAARLAARNRLKAKHGEQDVKDWEILRNMRRRAP